MEKEKIAELFMKGIDCSQVVAGAFAEELGDRNLSFDWLSEVLQFPANHKIWGLWKEREEILGVHCLQKSDGAVKRPGQKIYFIHPGSWRGCRVLCKWNKSGNPDPATVFIWYYGGSTGWREWHPNWSGNYAGTGTWSE